MVRSNILLGYSSSHDESPEPVTYSGDSHLMTVAPTGAGKGRGAIVPTLLGYDGPVVVVDPKGENYAITARFRREMGHKVLKLDPFGVSGTDGTDALNPLDLFHLEGAHLECDAQAMADMLAVGNVSAREPFWDLSSRALISGLIAYVATNKRPAKRNFDTVRALLFSRNVGLSIGSILQGEGDRLNRLAFDELAAFMQMPEKSTRPSVHATACSYFKAFASPQAMDSMRASTVDLEEIRRGDPVSIYLMIPPDKLQSHQGLLRVWVGTLLKVITMRRTVPARRTLFMLDEAAQLGAFHLLETVVSLCRGYGLQAWTFWQDLSQLKTLYPSSWPTMVNNCDVLQVFGVKNYMAAREFSELLGAPLARVRDLKGERQLLVLEGQRPRTSILCDYLSDPVFRGRFDENPFYSEVNRLSREQTARPSGVEQAGGADYRLLASG